ncbi:MAG: outer membrane protein transport protein [Polyangiaceae bacterium]|nr:outer membrane protein transport protein [Polyangiaceae bacterium]
MVLGFTANARAAGLFTEDRGVRPLGRGGAFVAGADDLGAIWYNPAGLADAGTALFIDLSWLNYSSSFARQTQVTDASGAVHTYEYPAVKGTTPFLPIPTIAGSYNFGKEKQYTLAFGVLSPYSAIASFPQTINGQPAPQRYSLVSLDGSLLAIVGGYFAYKPVEQFRIGFGLQALVGTFKTKMVLNTSPAGGVISAPEDPSYDALSQLSVGPIIAPSGNLGIIAEPDKHIRIGVSGQLPFWVNAPATIQVRLPTAAPFDNAYQRGEDARVKFKLPPVFRAGIELRTNPKADNTLRFEVSYVREFWSMHDTIDVRSKNIQLYDITGFPSPFGVAPISIPRHFQDSNSYRAGLEFSTNSIFRENRIDLRVGGAYETSAIPNEWVSALTYDANKVTIGGGGSVHLGDRWRADAVVAVELIDDTHVDPATAQVPLVNPVKGNPTATESINGGDYSAHAIILGVGVQYKF